MTKSQQFWRGFYFLFLITVLCGGLALPVGKPSVPARAAPLAATALDVVINEVAWAGTAASTNDEWIELYNTTTTAIDLTNWTLSARDGNPAITIPAGRPTIPPNGFFLLERSESAVNDITADYVYGGANLSNSGESLELRDASGNLIDTANSNGGAWPAGTIGTGSPANASMERVNALAADSDSNWATNNGLNRNGVDNATPTPNPINGTPKQINSATLFLTATATSTVTSTPTSMGTPTNTGTATNTGTPTDTATTTSTLASIQTVLINEVAWAGTVASSNDEWIELHNPSATATVDVTGWVLKSSDNTPTISLSGTIGPEGFLVIARNADTFQAQPAVTYTVNSTINLNNNGEILYLIDANGRTVDTANSDGGSWPAGLGSPTYATMERLAYTNQWITYGGTIPVAYDRSSNPIKGTPGKPNWIDSTTITTITADAPDPSLVNQNVIVTVTVIGGTSTPTGTVSVTSTGTSCTVTLSGGTGSCVLRFTSVGTKTITATYGGDSAHPASTDTESHQVSSTPRPTATKYRTPTPKPLPPPPLLVINEFVPRPGHDWNLDGSVNIGDEYIEILNHGVIDVNLSGYSLDDEVNIGSVPYHLPNITLKPGERHVFYESETGIHLDDGGDGVRLLKPNGQLMDAYNYFVVRYPDESYCRLPDNGGADDWNQNCFPTPGLQNSLSGTAANPPKTGGEEQSCPNADTLPSDFVLAECLPFGNNIWNPAYWDKFGWFDEQNLNNSPGKWPLFAE